MSGRDTELRFLRYLPGDTVVHRLWAGTKILAVGAVSLALSLRPTWRSIGIVGVIVVAALVAARIPAGAAPRIPGWIVSVLLMGGLVSVMWGPEPHRRILGVSVSPRAADQWTRLLLVGVELLVLAAVVAWTTRLGDLAPAMRRLLRPFRVLRLPVDELTVAVALCVRCFPLLAEELRILLAARRLRPELREGGFRAAMREPIDLLVAATTVCLRRSREMADAIEARGGFGEVSDGARRTASARRRGAGGARALHRVRGNTGRMTKPAAVLLAVLVYLRHDRVLSRSPAYAARRSSPRTARRRSPDNATASSRRERSSPSKAAAASPRRGSELRASSSPPREATGIHLGTSSCYRPLADQIAVRGDACGNGNCACAATISTTATVGTSYHGWGKAVDLTVDGITIRDPNSPAERWLNTHAAALRMEPPRVRAAGYRVPGAVALGVGR